MNTEIVTLSQMAAQLGMDRSNARKWLVKQGDKIGISPTSRRLSSGQVAMVWLAKDADALLAERQRLGFTVGGEQKPEIASLLNGGVFYVIRLVPDLAPNRIKVGFADDLNFRLVNHRTAAPTAAVACSWPCLRVWEPAVVACVRATPDARRISGEVFDVSDVDAVCARLTQFFGLLPDWGAT